SVTLDVVSSPNFAGSVTAGTGLTVTTGGATISAGGITVTGNSTITGTLGGLTGLTVASGGASITGTPSVTGTLSVSSTLTASTVASGLVLGSGSNSTTFGTDASSARAIICPDSSGTVALTSGTVTTATNLSGGSAGQIPYQSAPSTTGF